MKSASKGSVGREAYIEYLLLDRLLTIKGRTTAAALAGFFGSEASAMTDTEVEAAIDRLVVAGAAHRAGEKVWASDVARYITSLPEALPEAR